MNKKYKYKKIQKYLYKYQNKNHSLVNKYPSHRITSPELSAGAAQRRHYDWLRLVWKYIVHLIFL